MTGKELASKLHELQGYLVLYWDALVEPGYVHRDGYDDSTKGHVAIPIRVICRTDRADLERQKCLQFSLGEPVGNHRSGAYFYRVEAMD